MDLLTIGAVILRTIIIIAVAFLIVRLRGQRQLGQLSLFDTLVVIALGSAVGDVMIYPDSVVSLERALIALTALALFVFFVERIIAWLPSSASRMVYGEDIVIIHQGYFVEENLRSTRLTTDQVLSRLREKDVHRLDQVKIARLEADGDISVQLYEYVKEC